MENIILDTSKIPKHIAIIMDGNGRWAKEHGKPRTFGHKHGVDALRRTISACQELSVKYLTVYAFSTENWNRNQREVSFLMKLLRDSINTEIKKFTSANQVKLKFLGRIEQFTPALRKAIADAEEITSKGDGLQLNIMLNYGGRAELVDAVNKIIETRQSQNSSSKITEETFEDYLYTSGIPDPDLLIRTSGELRISNFLLWQLAYTEFWITPKYWPDFGKDDLIEAIVEYQHRQRRYGAY